MPKQTGGRVVGRAHFPRWIRHLQILPDSGIRIQGASKEGFIGPRGFGASMVLIGFSVVAFAGAQLIPDLKILRKAGIETSPPWPSSWERW